MASRLEDLLTTGDKQLASQAYEAAIDTYRTALGEAGAAEARVEARLQDACRARDAARGVVPRREPELPAPPQPEMAAAPAEPKVEKPAEPPAPPQAEMAAAPVQPKLDLPAEPPAPATDDRPVEPPSFQLIEDFPPALERPERSEYVAPKLLSILDSTPPAKEPDQALIMRIVLAAIIALLVCAAVILAPNKPSRPHGSSGGRGVTQPVLQARTEPGAIPANRPEHPTV
jgi:hypothetical protein